MAEVLSGVVSPLGEVYIGVGGKGGVRDGGRAEEDVLWWAGVGDVAFNDV